MHIFNPDHNLYCVDCGEGELAGDHGITHLIRGEAQYETAEIAAMYLDARGITNNDYYPLPD